MMENEGGWNKYASTALFFLNIGESYVIIHIPYTTCQNGLLLSLIYILLKNIHDTLNPPTFKAPLEYTITFNTNIFLFSYLD